MNENPPVVEIRPEVARSRAKSALNRHKTKIVLLATTVAGGALFLAGRKSKDVVESVDLEVRRADETPQD